MIEVSNLTCLRGAHKVLNRVSFSVQPGQLLLVEGPNGSGKTTLLRCLAGMVSGYQGQILLSQRQTPLLITDCAGLSAGLTAVQNLAWYGALRGLRLSQPAIMQALAKVGIRDGLDRQCGTMSAGQQKRVLLARLLLESAGIWLLDEPVVALDAAGIELVVELCGERLNTGGTVIVSLHQAIPFTRPFYKLNLETASLSYGQY